ncbi:MAG: 1-deoxy-D-xylulose 5-phosphate reductoisomerase [Candidatus Daviesbacteria bacterium GW2011_GWA1_36_8]|uniref:1-deoxy-D-xylulose-5-phosphate reductoisomerase n=1 Tax=Candidatus Daviesbacteria bacterium GW2011_GWA1_36_8 TaxID=1618417 RepID=A0A0G0HVX0_9BACT|nr:MAG: 1-deoxy-D-xylulose 5-phosphate reductoisomerase [Candidatus Daviesbacteria bacterium GW2011_GWA1_36_8]
MTNISVLGSTGSIGTQTLDVLEQHKKLLFPQAFSAGSNIELLTTQVKKFHPKIISVKTDKDAFNLKRSLGRKSPEIFWGDNGNIEVATNSKSDRVVIATPGFPGIRPTLEAIKKKKTIALATKEVLVAAGEVITNEAKKQGVQILPIDSEHSAIFQCLEGRSISEVSRVFLTCSGGPFRGRKLNDLKNVTVSQALNHPSWKMGKKITIDSATLMNKGFEVLEASWLFNIPIEKIKVVVHPQSVIHSAVEFIDGTIVYIFRFSQYFI